MNVLLCVLATLSLALTTTGAFSQSPDTVLLNGTIVTVDERNTIHQALAVRDGRIVALGKLLTDAARRAGRIGEAHAAGGGDGVPPGRGAVAAVLQVHVGNKRGTKGIGDEFYFLLNSAFRNYGDADPHSCGAISNQT